MPVRLTIDIGDGRSSSSRLRNQRPSLASRVRPSAVLGSGPRPTLVGRVIRERLPAGLSGEDIARSARVTRIVDAEVTSPATVNRPRSRPRLGKRQVKNIVALSVRYSYHRFMTSGQSRSEAVT